MWYVASDCDVQQKSSLILSFTGGNKNTLVQGTDIFMKSKVQGSGPW